MKADNFVVSSVFCVCLHISRPFSFANHFHKTRTAHSGSEVAEMMRIHRQFSVQTPRKRVFGWLNVEIC